MSEERKKIEVGLGQKGTPPEGAEIIKLEKATTGEDEVGGRYRQWARVVCPHCGVINSILEETTSQMWFTCGNCGGLFYY